ncbi:MAG: hypothetical protein U0L05_01220 [Schaedlerella sp.]|nr:hypothetical protein [Schaedlerella sp.]
MSKLNIVSKVRINGRLVLQEEIPQEEFKKLLREKIDKIMEQNGFDRRKTV